MDMSIDEPASPPISTNTNANTDINNSSAAAAVSTAEATVAAAARTTKLANLADSLKLEHQLLRVPLEHLKKTIRTDNRVAEKEVSAVINSVARPTKSSSSINDGDGDVIMMSSEYAVSHLESLVSNLQGLKRKLEDSSKVETLQVQRCRARLDHLDSANADNLNEWSNTRLKRILVDYLLRMSYFDSAVKLAESNNIQDFVDIDVFLDAKKIIDSLKNKDVAPALAWCSENRSRLKKAKSKFEFQLRLQEFIELVRANKCIKAIEYSRKYLSPWGVTNISELQRVVATLCFKSNTECEIYKVLFEEKQWDLLVEQFKKDFCLMFGMTHEPLLNIYLQAGLSALKTPFCNEENCPTEDPLSQEGFRKLASKLPYSKQHHSKLVCYITKELMDSENPPLVLPNGYVYSAKALEEMAQKNQGNITCPRTDYKCNFSELVKAFIS